MKNFLVRKTGITLIALIITVLVMLILSGVAISALTTDGSLFSKTQSAIEKYNNAVQKQDEKMASLINEMNMYYNKYSDKVNENPSELLDKIPPITATLEATNVAALTFTLKATGVDAPEISTNACSGISKYEFYIENTNGTFSLEKTIKTTDETVRNLVKALF